MIVVTHCDLRLTKSKLSDNRSLFRIRGGRTPVGLAIRGLDGQEGVVGQAADDIARCTVDTSQVWLLVAVVGEVSVEAGGILVIDWIANGIEVSVDQPVSTREV